MIVGGVGGDPYHVIKVVFIWSGKIPLCRLFKANYFNYGSSPFKVFLMVSALSPFMVLELQSSRFLKRLTILQYKAYKQGVTEVALAVPLPLIDRDRIVL